METLTGLLVLLTGVYAFLTYRLLLSNRAMVATMQEQITASVRPYVTFDIVAHGPLFEGVVTNSGATAAVDVKLSLEPAIKVELSGETRGPNLTSKSIALLPPKKQIDEFLGSFEELKSQNPSMRFSGQLNYRDLQRRTAFAEQFEIDLSFGEERGFINKPEVGGA
jgi:hypothetical protein